MSNNKLLQTKVESLIDHTIEEIVDIVDEKLGDKVDYRTLNGIIIHIEDYQFTLSDKLTELFNKYQG